MFTFKLPRQAVLTVLTPSGDTIPMLHAGDGRFLSTMPPLMLQGMAISEAERDAMTAADPVSVGWDGISFPGNTDALPVGLPFNTQHAMAAVTSAASSGDAYAKVILERIAVATRALDAGASEAGAAQAVVNAEAQAQRHAAAHAPAAADTEGGSAD